MQDSYFTGIDVPKKKPDICVMSKSKALKEEQASNHPPSIATVMAGIKEELSMSDDSLIICAEHTGRYTYPLICACKSAGCRPWRENPSQIKYCPGVTRGKADRVDARRKTCFERKVAEGKERMTVLNAVRARLVARMFAVIRNNRVYQPIYQFRLAQIIKIPKLLECFEKVVASDLLRDVLAEIILQSEVEFNYSEED